ncbi:GIY-YIG nuclease family protein [Aeromonas caviae]|uniref:GIY-YIG nuclease family protein n=1 Tax=Aeromonas caviae TaxID=648 RepID=UPI000FEB951D|nr:GIY-YIG nuclease family protein [Aeromonas caviae]MDH0435628.1 GIY-YIG nuclease family protein [Aeromonas caviae]MDH0938473.1 GIY-YIG nuclease family protein [Aeromonas caviae]MDH1399306.1 GIY-YIG nuclease family protein [Aeromonas caviae]MDH1851564.1 GIY-YIG nuclease family protein [Aeromonas caviae]RWT37508.1 GIY-YIG nuclease family protein [Aeromonas caviae]
MTLATPTPSRWFVYLVRTGTGALYAGISTDPERRLRQHQSGKGARALRGKGPLSLVWQQEVPGKREALRGKGPLSLVWQQEVPGKREALRLEYRLKQQSKAFKERLVHEPALWHGWSLSWLATPHTDPVSPP